MSELKKPLNREWDSLWKFWKIWADEFGDKIQWSGEFDDLDKDKIEKLPKENVKKYLKYVVHGEDVAWMDNSLPNRMSDMLKWVFSANGESSQIMPMPPQPYLGSPLEAKLMIVLNNPGYETRFFGGERQKDHAIGAAKSHVNRLKNGFDPKGKYPYPWACELDMNENHPFEYYIKSYRGKSADFIGNIFKGNPERLFHMDLCAYQSMSGENKYIDSIWEENGVGNWMPSQKKCLNLIGEFIKDRELDRYVVFRMSRQRVRFHIKKYLFEECGVGCKEFESRVIFMDSNQGMHLTRKSIGLEWLQSDVGTRWVAKEGLSSLLDDENERIKDAK